MKGFKDRTGTHNPGKAGGKRNLPISSKVSGGRKLCRTVVEKGNKGREIDHIAEPFQLLGKADYV